ncbi:hypothetical protein P692DRAFT_20883347 [Suillus brevipes Sb2]|nr:hypothetical protein P692DRAFT_20883347 [Suillus brevipes Sb2]
MPDDWHARFRVRDDRRHIERNNPIGDGRQDILSAASSRLACLLCFERSRRRFRSSRAYLVLASCHTAHWPSLGTEGIKDAISGFEDARKSDIENERLPPELFDAEEAKAYLAQTQSGSLPTTPADIIESSVSPSGVSVAVDPSMSSESLTSLPSLPSSEQMGPPRTPFKGRHRLGRR